jgi:putative ATP-binding cassette transporter
VLWSISPKLVIFLLSYALLGTFGTAAVFGGPLTRLKQKLLRLEADLRFGLVRLR